MKNMNGWFEKERLHFAAGDGNLDEVKRLIKSGCDVNIFDEGMSCTPLHYAIIKENYDVAKYLLKSGANINSYEENNVGETPLGQVAADCTYEMAEFLLRCGANPIIQGWMKISALDRARERKGVEGRRIYGLLLKVATDEFNFYK